MATMRKLDDEEEDDQVWVTHYSSNHHILLVGEGDFSFSRSLATLFGSASNICASSLDSYDDVVRKYKKARSNLEELKRLGAFLLHGVDATKLHLHSDLSYRKFDRVVFNFPHAGFHGSKESDFHLIRKHMELVFGFFRGASHLLRVNGQIHVSHKNKPPFSHWNLEELASRCSLVLMQCVAFEKSNYPGYENKRGDGSRCDQPFFLGDCSTFMFRLCRVAKEFYAEKLRCKQVKERESKYPQAFSNNEPVSFDHVNQRSVVSSNLSYLRDHNIRQVQDPLGRLSHRTLLLDYCQERTSSQFEDDDRFARERNHAWFQNKFLQLDKLEYTGRRSLLYQDSPFQTNRHHQEQCHERYNLALLDREMWTSFPYPYAGESIERRRLFCQDFPVQARPELLFERFSHFNGVSHGIHNEEIQRVFARTSFPHMYTVEAQERSLTRQRNLNIQPPKHW